MKSLLHRKRGTSKGAQQGVQDRSGDALKSAKGLLKTSLVLADTILQVDPTQIGKAVVGSALFIVNEIQVHIRPHLVLLSG
jgi:hypothetical protein